MTGLIHVSETHTSLCSGHLSSHIMVRKQSHRAAHPKSSVLTPDPVDQLICMSRLWCWGGSQIRQGRVREWLRVKYGLPFLCSSSSHLKSQPCCIVKIFQLRTIYSSIPWNRTTPLYVSTLNQYLSCCLS